ncbi:unnamed protein product [Gadus morhua 'NCC']
MKTLAPDSKLSPEQRQGSATQHKAGGLSTMVQCREKLPYLKESLLTGADDTAATATHVTGGSARHLRVPAAPQSIQRALQNHDSWTRGWNRTPG